MQKITAIFLILVLLTTVLPLKQVGNLLAKNQLTEEVNEQAPQTLEEKNKHLSHLCFCPSQYGIELRYAFFYLNTELSQEFSERIPLFPAADILVPPPKADLA